jgi:hypothetical protein
MTVMQPGAYGVADGHGGFIPGTTLIVDACIPRCSAISHMRRSNSMIARDRLVAGEQRLPFGDKAEIGPDHGDLARGCHADPRVRSHG